ncbi:hypothetical protein L9F63_008111 [Diploptera punctata]|uniref:Uncharacterized protein n=1 Tax=Diploptera punctata TaxID=6984 RepID=A0AAD7Z6M9_DIPPU|nr:hypothetical protein L9F63_008111 [Diploptera punctata]
MPQHKQPYCLEQLALKSLTDFMLKFGCHVIEMAHKPVEEEIWTSVRDFLHPGLPYSLANKLSTNLLDIIPKLEIEAESYLYSEVDTGRHMDVVKKFIEISLEPCLLELKLTDCSDFVCEILCGQLHRLTNLETLYIKAIHSKNRKITIRKILQENIVRLKHLKTFTCEKICTDEIIQVLAENCKQLEHLNIIFSKHVTVQSASAISRLQNLKHLNIWGTFFDIEACCFLLNVLSNLETFISDQDKVVGNVTNVLKVKSLMTICESPDVLVNVCPHLADVTLHFVDCNLSKLALLPHLLKFSVSNCNFDDIEGILITKASKLMYLKLSEVRHVNLKIINSCENLLSLEMLQCSYQPQIAVVDSIHFQNLKNLTIWEFFSNELEALISAYSRLKVINLRKVPIINDSILLSLVTKNKETLTDLSLKSCAYLNINTLKFVIDICDNLNRIVYRNEDSEFDELSDLYILKLYIDQNNLNVELTTGDIW